MSWPRQLSTSSRVVGIWGPPGGLGLGQADAVDLAVEVGAGLAARDRREQRADEDGGEGDETARGERSLADRDARQLEAGQDVVLGPEQRSGDRQDDGDRQPDEPNGDSLTRSVEAGHAPGGVPAAVVRGHEDDQQQDAADDADGAGLLLGV